VEGEVEDGAHGGCCDGGGEVGVSMVI
jgi:hypothetical protein